MPYYELITDSAALRGGAIVSGLYIVASLEIAIKDAEGAGLALRLHSYPSDPYREGYWAPPNMQYHVNTNYEAPQDLADIRERFERYINSYKLSMLDDVTRLAESFGMRGAVVKPVEDGPNILELKSSINQPSVTNAFCTVRFALHELNERSEANLVDREGRHGFVIYPLDQHAAATRVRHKVDELGTGIATPYFLGKPVISGLQQVLLHAASVYRIRRRAIDVSAVATRRFERGIIAVADVAGYGRVLAAQYLGFVSDPERERGSYQARVLSALEAALTATGTTQVQTAGDGFIAGYPTGGKQQETQEVFLEVVRHWNETVCLLDGEINVALARANNPARLGSRIAIGQGRYEWGRINGIGSFHPAFNGPAIVDTARLEQGLNSYVAEQVRIGVMRGDEHMFALDNQLADALTDHVGIMRGLGWHSMGQVTLRAKERTIEKVHMYRWIDSIKDE